MTATHRPTLLAALTALLLLTVFLPVIPAGGSSRAGTNNDTEPNDTFADAGLITGNVQFGGTTNGVMYNSKYWDIYRFFLNYSAGTGDRVTVNFTASELFPGSGISGVRSFLYAPGPYVVANGSRDALDQMSQVTALVAGWYYFGLEGSADTTTYTIRFQFLAGAGAASNNNNNPGNATSMAAPWPYTSPVQTVGAVADYADFYRVTLASSAGAADLLTIVVIPTGILTVRVDVFYASNNTYVVSTDDARNPPVDPNIGPPVKVTWGAKSSADHLVRVWAIGGSGTYTLTARVVSVQKDTNDDKASAVALSFTPNPHLAQATGEVGAGIDPFDYYSFPAYNGTLMNASITVNGYDASADLPVINLNVRDKDDQVYGTQVGQSPKPNGYSAVVVDQGTFDGPVTNYLSVEIGGPNSGGGAYTVDVTLDRPPRAIATLPKVFINESTFDKSLSLAALFDDDDDAADALTYTATPTGMLSPPGTLSIGIGADAPVTVTLTPKLAWTGSGTVIFNATDPYGLWAIAEVEVRVVGVNHEPTVKAAWNATKTWTDLVLKKDTPDLSSRTLKDVFQDNDTGDILAYDVTGTSPVREFGSIAGQPILKAVTVAGHVRIGFQLASNGRHNGGLSFTPLAGWTGEEVVTFNATDDGVPALSSPGVSLRLLVTTGQPLSPEWRRSLPGTLTFDEDGSGMLDLGAHSNDPDAGASDKMAYTLDTSATDTTNVTAAVDGAGMLSVTVKPDWCGRTTVGLVVTDVQGLTDNASLSIEVSCIPDAPAITARDPAAATATVAEGATLNVSLTVADPDTAAGSLLFRWTLDGKPATGALGSTYSYAPSYTAAGTHWLNVSINDSSSGIEPTASWQVTVTNVNRPPIDVQIISPTQNQSFKEGQKIKLQALAAKDPDGGAVNYTWKDETGAVLGEGQLTEAKLKKGTHQILLIVTDIDGGATELSVTVKVKKKETPGFEGLAVLLAILAAVGLVAVARRVRTR